MHHESRGFLDWKSYDDLSFYLEGLTHFVACGAVINHHTSLDDLVVCQIVANL